MDFLGSAHHRNRSPKAGRRLRRPWLFQFRRMLRRSFRLAPAAAVAAGFVFRSPVYPRAANKDANDDESLFTVRSALHPEEWRQFQVQSIEQVTHNTKRIRFALPTENHELGLTVASCLLTRGDVDGETVVRPYTPVSRAHQKGHFDLVVKRYPEGKMSRYITDKKEGDLVEMKGPIQKTPVTRNMKKYIGMVAGGSGITPMIQVIDHLLDDPRDNTEIRLLFANVSEDDILLRNKLDALALIHPRFKVYYTVDQPKSDDWDGFQGHINEEMLAKTMPPPSEDSLIMVCGPPPMMKAISGPKGAKGAQGDLDGALKSMKYSQDQVFKF